METKREDHRGVSGRLVLKKGEDRRLLSGHLWVFSNEVSHLEKPQGEVPLFVQVESVQGRPLGRAIYNPGTLIAARLLDPFWSSWTGFSGYLAAMIDRAIALRERFFAGTLYRVIHSEGDFLPGLVVDRYGDYLVVQVTTLAMEAYLPEVLEMLKERFSPRGIRVDRSLHAREIEGLPVGEDLFWGEVPPLLSLPVPGGQIRFPFRAGQKTGLFLDQARNIQNLSPVLGKGAILDAFCHVGAWSMAAAHAGADSVTGVDASSVAMDCYSENLKGLSRDLPVTAVKEDFFEWAQSQVACRQTYDTVVMDPPAFIKSRKKKEEGIRGYYAANLLAIDLVRPGGTLVTCSCSALLEPGEFLGIVRSLLKKKKRSGKIVYKGGAGADHPLVAAMEELEYLKCLALTLS